MTNHEGSALGAAMLGMYAIGRLTSLRESARLLPVANVIHPNLVNTHIYKQWTPIIHYAYRQLKPVYEEISGINQTYPDKDTNYDR
jgi:gluconokinase